MLRRGRGEFESDPIIVGFAAETGDAETSALEHAKAKLVRKGCDLLMCNEVGRGKVFAQTHTQGWILSSDGSVVEVEKGTKLEVAARIMDRVSAYRS